MIILKWRPQDKERISKLVNDGRLVIGPWYTQTDQLVISGESIVRNMYYGMKRCESFGKYMNVGYVPDSLDNQEICHRFTDNLESKIHLFWRGVSDDMVKHTDYQLAW